MATSNRDCQFIGVARMNIMDEIGAIALKLDEEDFKCLVRGGTLKILGGRIIIALSDIGFSRMDAAIDSAKQGIDIYKGHEK